MEEAVEADPCPNPSAHARTALWRRCIDYTAAAAFLVTVGLLVWTVWGISAHKIAMSSGSFGDYGIVELPKLIGPKTQVLEFSAIRVPSRVISVGSWIRWPVPEVLEVLVRGRDANGSSWEWEHTYLLACDTKGECKPLSSLRGVILYGCCDSDGGLRAIKNGWIYFRDARPAQEQAQPGPPSPHVIPQKPPSKPVQPGATIA